MYISIKQKCKKNYRPLLYSMETKVNFEAENEFKNSLPLRVLTTASPPSTGVIRLSASGYVNIITQNILLSILIRFLFALYI